jgi:hypothetical protein
MRLHTNTLTWEQISDALTTLKRVPEHRSSGLIANTVYFKTLAEHKSQSHERAFELQLSSWAKEDGDGRRAGNSGSYGAGDEFAATYDEWGWLLAALYELDYYMVCGSVKHPTYADADDYHHQTGNSYLGESLAIEIERAEDPYPYVNGKNVIGRRGAGRLNVDGQTHYGYLSYTVLDAAREYYEATPAERRNLHKPYVRYEPRTAEWVRAFSKGEIR